MTAELLTRENQAADQAVWMRVKVVCAPGEMPLLVDADTGLPIRAEGVTATSWHIALYPGQLTAKVMMALDGVPVEYLQ